MKLKQIILPLASTLMFSLSPMTGLASGGGGDGGASTSSAGGGQAGGAAGVSSAGSAGSNAKILTRKDRVEKKKCEEKGFTFDLSTMTCTESDPAQN